MCFFFCSSSVELFWAGFEDPHSGIAHFEACLGTRPGSCNIVPVFDCLLASSHIKTGLNMPENTALFATVTAYNKNNGSVSKSSDHFKVDSTPPEILQKPTFLKNFTTFKHATAQWEKSVLRISWKFVDLESPILRHVVTLVTHHQGHTPIENLELGSEDRLTISLDPNHWLHNGDVYKVLVTSCNAADLCTTAESDDLLIDSTPPHLGGFKLPMTWRNFVDSESKLRSNLNLTWYGFHDQESGINCFYIGVGKSYSGNELSDGFVKISSNVTSRQYNAVISISKPVLSDAEFILSIIAENNAGLMTSISRLTVKALTTTAAKHNANSSGIFEIEKHSCDIHFCNKDCTCAVIGRPCSSANTNMTCHDTITTENNPFNVTIRVLGGIKDEPMNITTSSSCLSAHWIIDYGKSIIKRFEWSIGEKDLPYRSGIFNSSESPWKDVGILQQIVHCLPQKRGLTTGNEYVVYVRVWVEVDRYLIFKSSPVMTDQTPPAVRKKKFLKDSDTMCNYDYDFIDRIDEITACWAGVFYEQQGRVIHYTVGLGTTPGGTYIHFLRKWWCLII